MKTTGIIAEYNPFHNGHALQIREAREQTGCDYVIAAMSPDFVQRGELAVTDKYHRTRMALLEGADLVLELPIFCATGSAEYFAEGGVRLLNSLGCVDYLSFGCEHPDLEILWAIADVFSEEPPIYKHLLQSRLSEGLSWPVARAAAFLGYIEQVSSHPDEDAVLPPYGIDDLPAILQGSNNILAIEYLRALRSCSSTIEPVPVQRTAVSHSSAQFDQKLGFASGAAIREMILNQPASWRKTLAKFMPSRALEQLPEHARDDAIRARSVLDRLLQYRLLSDPDYDSYLDVTPDLARRMENLFPLYRGAEQFASLVRTKQYTEARIRRSLLHILLSITQEEGEAFREGAYAPYIRILGFRRDSAPLLHRIRETTHSPLITKLADAGSVLDNDPQKLEWLRKDIFASHMYQMMRRESDAPMRIEYERSPVIV